MGEANSRLVETSHMAPIVIAPTWQVVEGWLGMMQVGGLLGLVGVLA